MSRDKMAKECKWHRKFDGHFTPNCVNDHGHRVNGKADAKTFKVCPYCVRPIKVIENSDS